jgi:hypothetical protein
MLLNHVALTLSRLPTDAKLQYENYQVVSLVQALRGAISSNMVAISLCCVEEAIDLHFYLDRDSADDRDMISDIETDLFALQFTNVPIRSNVHVAGSHIDVSQVPGRLVYLRHGTSAA